jgi:hypothetical protein
MKRMPTIRVTLLAIAVTMLLSGCQTTRKIVSAIGIGDPPEHSTNFYLDEEEIMGVQRVVMMPVHAPNVGLSSEHDIDEQFLSKLTATQLFEVVSISREDLARRFGRRSFSSAEPLTNTLFQYIQETSEADAVVFFDITTYHPFRPIKIGVRGKMIQLPDKEVLWALDELYDSANRKTSKEAVAYEKRYLSGLESSKGHDSILISPIRFTAYAAEKSLLSLPLNSLSRNY